MYKHVVTSFIYANECGGNVILAIWFYETRTMFLSLQDCPEGTLSYRTLQCKEAGYVAPFYIPNERT